MYVFSGATAGSCPNTNYFILPTNSTSAYVAAYIDSNPSNVTTDWLPVISCPSAIGSSDGVRCVLNPISNDSSGNCIVKLDIQISYTNIGSVLNPQHVLSAVIFNYQTLVCVYSYQLFCFVIYFF